MDPVLPIAARVDRLLRSLVGVADLHLLWRDDVLAGVHILRADRIQQHQLVRNIVSGLKAGFGIRLHTDHVHVHDTRALFDAACAAYPSNASVAAAAGVPAPARVAKVSDVAPKAAQASVATPAPEAPRAAVEKRAAAESVRVQRARVPELVVEDGAVALADGDEDGELMLERVDVERHGPLLRCRVTLRRGAQRYSAIAEAAHSATAEAELAARVTVDALRAGSLTEALVDGVGMLTLGGTSYIVAAVRDGANATPRASAAPLFDSMAWSAAAAVLHAVDQAAPMMVITRPVLSAG